MPRIVHVTAPSRCTSACGRWAAAGRQFGGVGAMIERPGLQLEIIASAGNSRSCRAAGRAGRELRPPLGRVSPRCRCRRAEIEIVASAAGACRPGHGHAARPGGRRGAQCLLRPAQPVAAGAGHQRGPRPAFGRRNVRLCVWRPDRRARQAARRADFAARLPHRFAGRVAVCPGSAASSWRAWPARTKPRRSRRLPAVPPADHERADRRSPRAPRSRRGHGRLSRFRREPVSLRPPVGRSVSRRGKADRTTGRC